MIKEALRKGLLKEITSGKHFMVVDVQPEYKNGFGGMAEDIVEYITDNIEKMTGITFLYNGDSLGMISENEYFSWWYELGLNEEILDRINFYDKGYAFFRYCMESGIEDESIVNLVKTMIEYDVTDSRELDEEFWNEFINRYGDEDIREILELSDDCINIPDLMDYLKDFNNIVLIGGGQYECLKEVEIALDALNKDYTTWERFVY